MNFKNLISVLRETKEIHRNKNTDYYEKRSKTENYIKEFKR